MVKLGRIYQELSPAWGFLDKIASKKTDHKATVICLLAPPRSGSTLTYQILNAGLKNFHLTNIWNLFYATPAIGGKVSERISKSYKTEYKSEYGFVPGLAGEAEGLKFWSYWTGQDMEEGAPFDHEKAKKLESVINQLSLQNKGAFVTGFLGHVFCIEALRSTFENIAFVHLQRDLLSNASSLYKGREEIGFSTKPSSISKMSLNDPSRVAKQLISIHNEIFERSGEDTIQINFSEICNDPTKVLDKLVEFCLTKNLVLERKENFIPPTSLEERKVDRTKGADVEMLYKALQKETKGHKFEHLFKDLLNG